MRSLWLVVLLEVACTNALDPRVENPRPTSPPPSVPSMIREASVRPVPITLPLPEAGPHPDYPTTVASGTGKIFTLEDPDRGPKVPTTYKLPPRGTLSWTTHGYCDLGPVEVA